MNEVVPELDADGAEIARPHSQLETTEKEEEEGEGNESNSSTPATAVESSALEPPSVEDVAKKIGEMSLPAQEEAPVIV